MLGRYSRENTVSSCQGRGNKGNFDDVLASLIQAHTGALQPLIYGKECYIFIVIYLSYTHKQFQVICVCRTHEAYNETTLDRQQSKTSILSTNVDQNS